MQQFLLGAHLCFSLEHLEGLKMYLQKTAAFNKLKVWTTFQRSNSVPLGGFGGERPI